MKTKFFILISFMLVTSLTVSTGDAGTKEISGKATMTYIKKEIVPISDNEGHIIMLGVSSGINSNTGNVEHMEGATATTRSTADITKGNGPQAGYFTLAKEGNETVAKYSGVIKTVLSEDKKPITSFAGKWEYSNCKGKYEGCTGTGTYQGYFISENEYVVEYKGSLSQ